MGFTAGGEWNRISLYGGYEVGKHRLKYQFDLRSVISQCYMPGIPGFWIGSYKYIGARSFSSGPPSAFLPFSCRQDSWTSIITMSDKVNFSTTD